MHSNCPSCDWDERISQILQATCKAMLGNTFMAFYMSRSSWSFYTTTANNAPGFDGCGSTGGHSWGTTNVETSSNCGGYYRQIAFINEIGCIEMDLSPQAR